MTLLSIIWTRLSPSLFDYVFVSPASNLQKYQAARSKIISLVFKDFVMLAIAILIMTEKYALIEGDDNTRGTALVSLFMTIVNIVTFIVTQAMARKTDRI
eukprot:UN15656